MERMLIAGLFLNLFVVLTKSNPAPHQNCNQLYEGWTVVDQQCVFREDIDNCRHPSMFRSWEECQLNILGTNDYCSVPSICNRGFCASTRSWTGRPSYKCYCDGTGYYGKKCETRCPQRIFPRTRHFPIACIFI